MTNTLLPVPVIRTTDGSVRYQCTGHDMLTLARSIRKESKTDAPELAWCYAQRLVMLHKRRGGSRPSLASIITSHSQPINPKWFPDGEKCRPGGPYHGEQPCAAAASRPGNASIPWERIESGVRADVLDFARARVSNPVPRATDFAAESLVDRKIGGANPDGFVMVRRGDEPRTNSFVSEPPSRAWPSDGYVRVEFEGRTASALDGFSLVDKALIGASAAAILAVSFFALHEAA